MRSISNTVNRLAAQRARLFPVGTSGSPTRLRTLDDFGSNPGKLNAYYFVPDGLKAGSGLVVVLHGCTQDAAGFDRGTGWSQLAEEHGFAVLAPEQTRANNFNLCFNWYEPGNSRRAAGEPLSIVQMIDAMVERHGIDPAKVFVTGLSAGGAMTSVMLATYPEKFAGGAIVAGLPFGSATNIPEAFDRMRGHGGPSAAALAASIRKASPGAESWPSVAVWHGTSDAIVDASNGEAIVDQWRRVHGAKVNPDEQDAVNGYPHRAWRDTSGRVVLEEYSITGMGHGTPIATGGENACGVAGPYMLDAAISSTHHIAKSWGLITTAPRLKTARPSADRPAAATRPAAAVRPVVKAHSNGADRLGIPPAVGVGKVIEDALRAAGLML